MASQVESRTASRQPGAKLGSTKGRGSRAAGRHGRRRVAGATGAARLGSARRLCAVAVALCACWPSAACALDLLLAACGLASHERSEVAYVVEYVVERGVVTFDGIASAEIDQVARLHVHDVVRRCVDFGVCRDNDSCFERLVDASGAFVWLADEIAHADQATEQERDAHGQAVLHEEDTRVIGRGGRGGRARSARSILAVFDAVAPATIVLHAGWSVGSASQVSDRVPARLVRRDARYRSGYVAVHVGWAFGGRGARCTLRGSHACGRRGDLPPLEPRIGRMPRAPVVLDELGGGGWSAGQANRRMERVLGALGREHRAERGVVLHGQSNGDD